MDVSYQCGKGSLGRSEERVARRERKWGDGRRRDGVRMKKEKERWWNGMKKKGEEKEKEKKKIKGSKINKGARRTRELWNSGRVQYHIHLLAPEHTIEQWEMNRCRIFCRHNTTDYKGEEKAKNKTTTSNENWSRQGRMRWWRRGVHCSRNRIVLNSISKDACQRSMKEECHRVRLIPQEDHTVPYRTRPDHTLARLSMRVIPTVKVLAAIKFSHWPLSFKWTARSKRATDIQAPSVLYHSCFDGLRSINHRRITYHQYPSYLLFFLSIASLTMTFSFTHIRSFSFAHLNLSFQRGGSRVMTAAYVMNKKNKIKETQEKERRHSLCLGICWFRSGE